MPLPVERNTGGLGQCKVCNHRSVLIFNKFIVEKSVEVDGVTFVTGTALAEHLNKKYPDQAQITPDNITRHKKHVPEFGEGIALVIKDNKLYRPTAEGELEPVPMYGAVEGLAIVISVGIDAISRGTSRVGAKTTIEAIKILADIQKGQGDADSFEKAIEEYLRGRAVKGPRSAITQESDDFLASLPVVSPQPVAQFIPEDMEQNADFVDIGEDEPRDEGE
jgi:hypothetical protein